MYSACERARWECAAPRAANATHVALYTANGMTYGEVTARCNSYAPAFAAFYNEWVEGPVFGYNYDILDRYDVT